MTQRLSHDEIQPGVILMTPDNIECRVDRIEGTQVHMTALKGQYKGQTTFHLPISELTGQDWRLTTKAA